MVPFVSGEVTGTNSMLVVYHHDFIAGIFILFHLKSLLIIAMMKVDLGSENNEKSFQNEIRKQQLLHFFNSTL